MTKEEEKYTTIDTEQCKWWVNGLFNIAKEKAYNSHNFDDGEEMQAVQNRSKVMVEYIERQKVITKISRWLLDRETKGNYAVLRNMLDDIPTADVVEREKIDRAIEEISEYASIWTSYTMDMSKEQIAVRCLNDYATQFLDILKRNIGEQNN